MPVGDYNITYGSVPDYDDWGPDQYWGCDHWVQWHQALKAMYGKEGADNAFMNAWNQSGWLSSNLDCRTFNTSFRDYFAGEGLLDAIISGAGFFGPILNLVGAGGDVVSGIGGGVSSIGNGLEKFLKLMGVLVPIILLMVLIYFGYRFYKKQ